ncbi:zinc-dependent peptidase [Lysobacter spongiae]|uniref:Zinc-dependent peptidase n=1 Tax=Marilutibacter spongiae TaxID=2025720 RepID=A0A7W3TIP7_9GAMM|nr:zinc-dependent peptidase [Lysobacter spongiae]
MGARPEPLAAHEWQAVRGAVPWIDALDDVRSQRLAALTARFLHEKTVTPVDGLALDAGQRAQLAAMCCLPLLEFGEEGLHGWAQLIVYPEAFRVRRHHVDVAGVVHEGDDTLIGESWDAGPLILSWGDVRSDCETPREGFCVAVHEMAHKLDALDGEMDGTPPLPRPWQREWARDFQAAFDAFNEKLDASGEDDPSDIDPYAAESPEEFFAVASEYHFSDPARLARTMPAVAAHLTRFYGPSPFA